MKKYKIAFYYDGVPAPDIREIEVDKETDISVWINGARRQKHSAYEAFFDTWGAAYERLRAVANLRVQAARNNIERYEQILAMRNPEDAE